MVKRYGGPTPSDIVAALFRRGGVDVDAVRLEDRVAALKSRAKINDAAHIQLVKDLALAAKKARRACELAEWDWRHNPCGDTLAASRAAQGVRGAAEAELREACLNDEQLVAEVTRWAGRS
jgi:hypothetical protein